jgi:hypothetical protein
MYLAEHAGFADRARTFSSLDGVAELFDSASPVYKAAEKMFGQELVPQNIIIGRKAVQGGTISVSSVLASYTYKLTVNGQTITFTSDDTPTATEIVTGLKAAFDAATPAMVVRGKKMLGRLAAGANIIGGLSTVTNLAAGNISMGRAVTQGIILAIGIGNTVLGFGLSMVESLVGDEIERGINFVFKYY